MSTRIAIVKEDKCKPKKCRQECKRYCPSVAMGNLCIDVDPSSKIAFISEDLCTGCGICIKKCPFEAIEIINLPRELDAETVHRYSANSFKLHRLPTPRISQVLGLVGANGTGKSTALKVLAGKLKPNLGNLSTTTYEDVLRHFRGSELQSFFTRLLEEKLKAVIKPQYVDMIPKSISGKVSDLLQRKDSKKALDLIQTELQLTAVMDRDVEHLSGGELQRFAIAVVAVQDADIYVVDEPSSYLDIKQRLKAAQCIRNLVSDKNYVIVVEHDLSVLDYLSDFICVLYGVPGVYGIVTMPFAVREGINIFLSGFIPTENMRFRDESLAFRFTGAESERISGEKKHRHDYPEMRKRFGTSFNLVVEAGSFNDSEILVMLGENGTGKTSFVRMLAGLMEPDGATATAAEKPYSVSYKPQKIAPSFEGSVRLLLHQKIPTAVANPQFATEVLKPMAIDPLMDNQVSKLSGGELQRVALVLCLGKPADLYLLDEPSAYLDSEQRIVASKVIKRFIMNTKKTAFVVEHDFIMATYLADRVIVYEGIPGVDCVARSPQPLLSGMNLFLKNLQVTFRRDPVNYRPRINKKDSLKDVEQKRAGTFFYLDE